MIGDCTLCGGPVEVEPVGDRGPVEECRRCGNAQPPPTPRPDRAEIREAVRASRTRRLLGPSCFGRRHHLCKASGCRCLCHDKTKGAAE